MKKWILLIVLASSFSAYAQQAKAIAGTKTNTTTTTSNVSVSVSDDDSNYAFAASFDKQKTSSAKKEIVTIFGEPTTEGKYFVWRKGENLEIKLREGRVSIEFEKGDQKLYDKVKSLGDSVSEVIGSKK